MQPQIIILHKTKVELSAFESDLLQGCKSGSRKHQKLLFDTWYADMYAVCRRYLMDDDRIKDAVQEGFIKVFTRINSYNGEGSLKSWVHRIMVRTAIDAYRSYKRMSLLFVNNPSNDNFSYKYDEAVSASIEGEMMAEEIHLIIDMLPPVQKAVFNMAAIDNFSHKEIGEALGITDTTSKWHLYEARKKLKALLENYYPERKKTAYA